MPAALTVPKGIDYLYGAYVSSRLQTQLNNLRTDEFRTNKGKNKTIFLNKFLLSLSSLSSLFQTLGRKKD